LISYTDHMEALIRDIVSRGDEFRHVDCAALLTAVSQARTSRISGDLAQLIPLRFEGGATQRVVRGRTYYANSLRHASRDILYSFLLPRFCDLSPDRKLLTVFHELYHISPEFNGDIRRFAGRNYAHGSSRRKYDALMEELVQAYSKANPPGELLEFLQHDFAGLNRKFGGVTGRRVRRRWAAVRTIANAEVRMQKAE